MQIKRVILIIADGLGIGELPDAAEYSDAGSNTLKNLSYAVGGVNLPNLEMLGLGHLGDFRGIRPVEYPIGCYGIMAEQSKGKDSTAGHWEIAGMIMKTPLPTYPNGFPPHIIDRFKEAMGRDILGNITASGTEIIKEMGEEHVRTGFPIVYTSADSVFQIAAHEEIIPIDELYRICRIARNILVYPDNVARVIARPFIGKNGSFVRTVNRRDFSLEPPEDTLLDRLKQKGINVTAVGKIDDLFAGQGITKAIHTSSDMDGVDQTIRMMDEVEHGLIFTNLVDFDTIFGHRNDFRGFANNLIQFDRILPEILSKIREDDLLIMTADHGNDPTTISTDHSREYVPLLIYGNKINKGLNLGRRDSFADVGLTIAEIFGIEGMIAGKSFLSLL